MNWRKILYSCGIVLGLGLLAQQAWRGLVALQEIQSCMVRPGFLLGASLLYIVAYFIQMAAWAFIMREFRAPLTPQAVVKGYALSFLPRYIPGSVWGYVSRNEWLWQTHGVGYAVSTTASLLEAAMLLMTAGVLGAMFWLPTLWQTLGLAPVHASWLQGGVAVLGIVGTWVVWRMLPWLARKVGPTRFGVQNAQSWGQSSGLWAATLFLYVGFWFLQGGALLTIAQTLCVSLEIDLFAATAAFGLAWALGFLVVFVPAGLGVREWTLGTLLVTFTLIQPGAMLQPGEATLLAVISRFGLIVAEVVVLLIGVPTVINKVIKNWWTRKHTGQESR